MIKAEQVIEKLQAHRRELEELGVRHAALFGSMARNEAREDSDIDIAVTFADTDDMKGAGYFGAYQEVMERLEALFAVDVDLTDERMMRPAIRPAYESDHIRAF